MRATSGKKNKPPMHKQAVSGPMKSSFNRGDAGKRRKPANKPSGKKKDIGSGSSEFADTGH